MKLLITFLFIVSLAQYSYSNNETSTQKNIIILDGICFQNQNDLKSIEYIVSVYNGKKVPKEMLHPAMRTQGGKAFFITYSSSNYIVSYTESGVCNVMSKNIEPDSFSNFLLEKYDAKLIDTQATGAQVVKMFLLNKPSTLNGSIISIVYGEDYTGISEGSISFIPAHIVKKNK